MGTAGVSALPQEEQLRIPEKRFCATVGTATDEKEFMLAVYFLHESS